MPDRAGVPGAAGATPASGFILLSFVTPRKRRESETSLHSFSEPPQAALSFAGEIMSARYVYECPYYIRYRSDKNEMHCEGSILYFKSADDRARWLSRYCCNHPGWMACSNAKRMTEFYEEDTHD